MTSLLTVLTLSLVPVLNFILLAIFALLDNYVAVDQYSFILAIIPGISILYFLLNLYLCIKCCKIKFQTTKRKERKSFKNLLKDYIQNAINYQYERSQS